MTTLPGGSSMTPKQAFHDLARRIMYIHDPDNVSAFLLNYRAFEVDGADLCASWIDEFVKVCEKEKTDEYRRAVRKKTSERMLDFLDIWIAKYDPNFTSKEVEKLLEVLKQNTDSAVLTKFKLLLVREKGDKKKGSERERSSTKPDKIVTPAMETPPTSALENFKFDLMDQFQPSQIAKQLTMYEWEIFSYIKPEEFLNQAWAKKDKYTAAPNINLLIEQFNKVSFWVAIEILTAQGGKDQTRLLRKFISLAYTCVEYHNYNTALEILAGINHGAVQRLKGIWEKLPEREEQLYRAMDNLMQPRNNFRNYRKDLSQKPLPAFPQISLICRDFTYIYDGNPKYNSDGSINFDLPMLTYERVKEIEKYQSLPYDFARNDKIMSYFPYLAKFDAYDEDDLHNLSLEAQPSMWGSSTPTIAESDSHNSDTLSESSDTASSESGSSRYIKNHGGGSPLHHRSHKAGHAKRSDKGSSTDSDGSSSSRSEKSDKKPKSKKPKKKGGDGSEDGTPRTIRGEKEERRKKRVVHKTKGPAVTCQSVKVPDRFLSTFSNSEMLVDRFFSQVGMSLSRGSLTIGKKRYLLVRTSSLSVDFFKRIRKTFDFSTQLKSDEFARKLLFNFGQLIAKSDVRTLTRTVRLHTPAQMFSAGPVYQAYAGLGFSELLEENKDLPNSTPDPDTFCYVFNQHVSSEAAAWKAHGKTHSHPCCFMLNGYISGWASGTYGIPLVGVELLCRTKGDEVCKTMLCSPERAKVMTRDYMLQHDLGEDQAAKVKIPSLLTAQDAEMYETARKEMNQKQRKVFKSQKLLNTTKCSKEEVDARESKLVALERKSLHYFSTVFSERMYNPRTGQVRIGDEGYVFIRGKAISKGFVELILRMFPMSELGKGLEFAFDFLFDMSHSIGKSDYRSCVRKLQARGRPDLHPLKRMVGLKKAFSNLGWGSVRFDFRTASLVYSPDDFFFRFILEGSFEADTWGKAKQKLKEEEEAKREVAEAAAELVRDKGITLEEAFRKLEKANKGNGNSSARKRKMSVLGDDAEERAAAMISEVTKSPVCVMAAGYANGYIRKCFKNKDAIDRNLDLVVVEVACRATGNPSCEFLVCSKNMVQSSVKTYLKEKNQPAFLPNIKYYNVMRKKDGAKKK